jgi:hypothetical protein
MGKDDCQPSGPRTITRITAHQVEVLWEGETASAIAARNCTAFDRRNSSPRRIAEGALM